MKHHEQFKNQVIMSKRVPNKSAVIPVGLYENIMHIY